VKRRSSARAETPPRISDAARRLAALRVLQPDEWRATVRAALVECGSIAGAAERLGVARRAVGTWVSEDRAIVAGLTLRGPGRPKAGG
jgi:hypothetical protein